MQKNIMKNILFIFLTFLSGSVFAQVDTSRWVPGIGYPIQHHQNYYTPLFLSFVAVVLVVAVMYNFFKRKKLIGV